LIYDLRQRLPNIKNNLGARRILVLVPSFDSYGGISHYFQVLRPHFSLPVDYFFRGVRTQHSKFSRLMYPIIQMLDYLHFFLKLILGDYSFVHLNTSFGWTGLIRDYCFILITRLLKKPYIVFFRGIDTRVVAQIEKRFVRQFRNSFLKADRILVLSNELMNTLKQMQPDCRVTLETTVVDEKMVDQCNQKGIAEKLDHNNRVFLFLARLEKAKGTYETIEAFKLVQNKYPDIQLNICGDGKELIKVQSEVGNNPNITLHGFVTGEEKKNVFSSADIYLFPSYAEGMPNSVLEAIAFGLPVITTPVGGLVDFFVDRKMGLFVEQKNAQDLAAKMIYLIENPTLALEMGLHNFQYARSHFYSSVVAARLENYYNEIING